MLQRRAIVVDTTKPTRLVGVEVRKDTEGGTDVSTCIHASAPRILLGDFLPNAATTGTICRGMHPMAGISALPIKRTLSPRWSM